MSKELSCVLVVSDDVIKQTELNFGDFDSQVVKLRGKQQSVLVYALQNPLDMPLANSYADQSSPSV